MAEFLCDYKTEVKLLPTNVGVGSLARVIEDGNKYILNSEPRWVLQPQSGGGGGGGGGDTPSGESDIIDLDGPITPGGDDSDIIVLQDSDELDTGIIVL